MANDFLNTILDKKRAHNARKRSFYDNIKKHLDATMYVRYGFFKKAISRPGQINLIAEIKKASPSKGIIRQDFNVDQLAQVYEEAGVAAMSVLTEEDYFLGKPAFLKQVSEKFNTPTLMKDFIIDEGQIYEGRYCGASAVLLIVAALSDEQLCNLLAVGRKLDMDCLVEVHDDSELERAIACEAEIIGINNRNLHTFKVDVATSERLIPGIPKDKVIVAESGISSYAEVVRLQKAGAHAVLIGETFLREKDVARKIREVMYGQG
ncbi:MAG: indole-3-glycerol phosphate synthase TrpC [Candidatus Omnitrophica bacterium]|nr:indole-3-glycerol phosphate synthase TrpC [Candidatus Omnitrophota bacterium]